MSDSPSVFSRRLKELYRREENRLLETTGEKMLQAHYAKRVGCSVNALRGWLRGSGEPSTEVLARIAEIENVSVDWLVGKKSAPTSPSSDTPQGRLLRGIMDSDLETLLKLEQYFNYLEYQKGESKKTKNA